MIVPGFESIEEVLQHMEQLAAQAGDRLKGHSGCFELNLTDGRVYTLLLEDGAVRVAQEKAEKPDCVLESDEKSILQLLSGELSPAKALLLRRVRIHGGMDALRELMKLI